jgi:hypothetical protein
LLLATACGAAALLGATAFSAAAIASEGGDGPPAGEDFGAGLTLSEVTPLAEVVENPESHMEGGVLVSGRISDVCQKKGCWTVLTDGDVQMRVRFKDYGFFLPTDCSGKQAYVEGVVASLTVSEKTARHYARESGQAAAKGKGGAAAPAGEAREIGFTATGVRLVERD